MNSDDTLQEHPQMIITLELCKVFIIVNGRLYNNGNPLSLPQIPPMKGAEEAKEIPIPEILIDPVSGQKVSTIKDMACAPGVLILRTSESDMRYLRKGKGRHKIVFKAHLDFIGFVPVSELGVLSSYQNKIYGECLLDSLETFKQNDRGVLSRGPLSRAVIKFIAEKIQELLAGQLSECSELDDEEFASCIDYSLNRLTPQQARAYEQKRRRIDEHLKTCDYHGAFFCLLISLRCPEKGYELN